MRWLFADPSNPHASECRSTALRRFDAWWQAFTAHVNDLDAAFARRADFDVPGFMAQHLQAIDRRLCWEFGAAVKGKGHRLVITPESDRHLRPMVRTLLERAPALPGWEFYPYRLAQSAEMAHQTVEVRGGGITARDAQVRITRGRGNRVDLAYRSSSFSPDNSASGHAAVVFSETLLGEEALDHWVGLIEAEPAPKPGLISKLFGKSDAGGERGRFLPLDRAKPTFDAVVAAVRDQLPDRPLHEKRLTGAASGWMSYQIERQEQPKPAPRADIFVGSSAVFDATQAAAAPGFSSARFSRCGETFCYLMLDHADVPRGQWVDFRAAFEDALEPPLRQSKAGCIFANATGLRYSYVDLAVTDVGSAADLIRSVLRPLRVPDRSWLLFFDPDLAAEWIGLGEDAPPPPGLENEG